MDRESFFKVIGEALPVAGAAGAGEGYTSLSIGRLVDYPWLSQYLAAAAKKDGEWDARKGRTRGVNINKFVSGILSRREMAAQFDDVFAKGGYKFAGVSVEKVLVGREPGASEAKGGKGSALLPYDAQVWFRLERR